MFDDAWAGTFLRPSRMPTWPFRRTPAFCLLVINDCQELLFEHGKTFAFLFLLQALALFSSRKIFGSDSDSDD